MAVIFDKKKFKKERELVPVPDNIRRRMLGSKRFKKERDNNGIAINA